MKSDGTPARAERIKEMLAALKEEFVRGLPARIQQIDEQIALLDANAGNRAAIATLRQALHNIAGIGGTHGLDDLTAVARAGELMCDGLLQGSGQATRAELRAWGEASRSLHAILERESASQSTPIAGEEAARDERPSVLVAGDASRGAAIVGSLTAAGFAVREAATFQAAVAVIREGVPSALVTDTVLEGGSGSALVELLRAMPMGQNSGSIVLAMSGSLEEKVEAIRCGADACFDAPAEPEMVSRRVLYLVARAQRELPRILYVEDDVDHASFAKNLLREAGYQIQICTDPSQFEESFSSFHPDLVLMDIHLSREVNGYDLARFIRQDDRNATLPILFLTAEGELQSRIEGVQAGGDDQIVKPVSPALLLSTVSARLERSRLLKSLLERDGLTGLLTHTAFHERLIAATASVSRHPERRSVLVMLDLDHFKSINDTYGHPAGDRVLSSLGALVSRRTRRGDSCGRYGGEEFALLLEDVEQKAAVSLVERILAEFSAIEHPANAATPLRATFSAGVAELRPGMTADEWKEAADSALYAAKRAGRRRVAAAPGSPTAAPEIIPFRNRKLSA